MDPDWLSDALPVDDDEQPSSEPSWLADAEPVGEAAPTGPVNKVEKELSPSDRGLNDREVLSEDFVAADRLEGGRARGVVTELGVTTLRPNGTDSYDPSGDRQAVIYEPSESVRSNRAMDYVRDDSVEGGGAAMGGAATRMAGALDPHAPGMAAALRYAQMMTPSYSPGAIATGASDVLTLGHTDELAGANAAVTGGNYEQSRNRARVIEAEQDREAGGSRFVGNVAGAGLMAAAPGASQAAAARGVGVLGRIGAAVGEGVVTGALAGSGASDAELGSPEHLLDTSTGGVIGGGVAGGVQGAGEAVGAGVRAVAGRPDVLRENAALRRIRGMFGDSPPSRSQLSQHVRGDASNAPETYAALRATGVRSIDDAPEALERTGQRLGEIAARIDGTAARTQSTAGYRTTSAPAVDATRIAQRMREHAEELARSRGVPESVVGAFEAEAQRWEAAVSQNVAGAGEVSRSGPMTFQRAWDFRRQMSDPRHWRVDSYGNMPLNADHKRAMYSIVRDEMLRGASQVDPALSQEFARESRAYSVLSPFAEAAENARIGAARNRQVSLTDTIAAASGTGLVGTLAGGVANRAMRSVEHRAVAPAMERLADIVQRQPGTFGQYGSVLANAAQRGSGALAATWYVLSQQQPQLQEELRASETEDEFAVETTDEEMQP